MPTADRPQFVQQAIRCFRRQSYQRSELIVVDDDTRPSCSSPPEDVRIRYLRLPERLSLGEKINLAIEQTAGDVIQKLDDDDWYAPEFLARMVASLDGAEAARSIAALDCFHVLVAHTGHLTFSGHGWFSGNSLCFHRELWEKCRFRDVPGAEDWFFLKDHVPRQIRVCEPALAVVVRHQAGHAWTRLGDNDVTSWFHQRPPINQPLSALLPPGDVEFYASLRTRH